MVAVISDVASRAEPQFQTRDRARARGREAVFGAGPANPRFSLPVCPCPCLQCGLGTPPSAGCEA